MLVNLSSPSTLFIKSTGSWLHHVAKFMEAYMLLHGNVFTVGVKRLRCAGVLVQRETDELSDDEIITVGAKRFRCTSGLKQC